MSALMIGLVLAALVVASFVWAFCAIAGQADDAMREALARLDEHEADRAELPGPALEPVATHPERWEVPGGWR